MFFSKLCRLGLRLAFGDMQSASGPTATVVQVSPKGHGTTPTIIQQNGQHVLVGKLATSTSRPATGTTELNALQSNNQAIYPAHYIETIAEQTIYAANGENGHVQYQGYAPIIYAPVSGGQTYYQTATGQVLASAFTGSSGTAGAGTNSGPQPATLGAGHAQLVTHQGATYLVQGGQLEEDPSSISHTAKASPLTVQWLVENYETAEGVSLPRSTLYFHYLQHCNEHKLEPMNPASFGKLIRSVFFGLRTRRLGTRGNSKYHYYGIRIKAGSPLNHFVEDAGFSLRHYPNYHRQTMDAAAEWKSFTNSSIVRLKSGNVGSTTGAHGQHSQTLSTQPPHSTDFSASSLRSDKPFSSSYLSSTAVSQSSNVNTENVSSSGSLSSPIITPAGQHQHAQFLGEASSALPNLDEICRSSGLPVPGETDLSSLVSADAVKKTKGKLESTTLDPSFFADAITFCRLYALSASYMLDAVVNLDFTAIETVWKAFWRTEEVRDSRLKQSLPQDRLYALVSDTSVLQFVRLYDHTFYQSLAEVLIPNVLRPIPHTLTQAIRNFAKSLEGWMRQATQGLDSTLVRLKLSAVSALAQTLRRYTSLNHLAQAARTVLKNHNQINQMLTDLNRVDFNNVQEQASWVCQCSDATVSQLEQDFKRILHKHASLEEWAQWLDTVVSSILQPLEGNSVAYTRAAHQLILKWSFYSSMVIRDLTLRSAASFGSFHLIRLLFDEYIFYLVEHKVAAHLGMTPVAVMGEMGRDLAQQHYAQSRSHSDLIGRREYKSGATNDVDTISFATEDDHYLPLLNEHRSKQAVCSNTEEDEEVDEYLDDEDEVDDSTGDESAMLKRAHESVQAYCRQSTASLKPSENDALDSVVVSTTTEDGLEATNISESSLCSVIGRDAVPGGTECLDNFIEESNIQSSEPSEQPGPGSTGESQAVSSSLDEEKISEDAFLVVPQPSCSPPPIVANPIPVRKVVRVTTFCDPNPANLEVPTPSLTPTDAINSKAVLTARDTHISVSTDKSELTQGSPAKRLRLSQA
ncbi:hypothetical protein T265_05437 [Opisthorchis viverrini]|uniref:RFX-type winged-helix domain-containing protein n=2 Tax=Opisthorchis viverrini TaxID=6198 RepID=A0A074ZW08_OPIVI|nr:hypothetical protein T265_05437 [Opisthorchis viverrini]KER27550.1 hypothetical protein T265_05437 [Opisthorchis viverrini]